MIYIIRRTVAGKEQFYTGHCSNPRNPHGLTIPAWGNNPFEARSWRSRLAAESWKKDLHIPGRVIETTGTHGVEASGGETFLRKTLMGGKAEPR